MAVNPIGAGLTQGRVDQGVDYSGSGPLYALDSGTIVNLTNSGWPNNTFIVLKLNQAINGQQYVYYAEDINPVVRVGQKVSAGQLIGNATGGSSGIEIGWANPNLGQAAAAGQFHGNNATALGQDFLNLIHGGKNPPGGQASTGSSSGSTAPAPTNIGGVLSGATGLLRDVATVLDYIFGMFGRGQGWRMVFTLISGIALFASYKTLVAAGAVPAGFVPRPL